MIIFCNLRRSNFFVLEHSKSYCVPPPPTYLSQFDSDYFFHFQLTPNVRVIHIKAGELDIDKESIHSLLPNFAEKIN